MNFLSVETCAKLDATDLPGDLPPSGYDRCQSLMKVYQDELNAWENPATAREVRDEMIVSNGLPLEMSPTNRTFRKLIGLDMIE